MPTTRPRQTLPQLMTPTSRATSGVNPSMDFPAKPSTCALTITWDVQFIINDESGSAHLMEEFRNNQTRQSISSSEQYLRQSPIIPAALQQRRKPPAVPATRRVSATFICLEVCCLRSMIGTVSLILLWN